MTLASSSTGVWTQALRAIADASLDHRLREKAARQLDKELRRCAPNFLKPRLVRRAPSTDALDEAIQCTLIIAATTRSPFRGDSETGARAWCKRVLLVSIFGP